MRQLQGTDVDADTAQRVLDDTTQLGLRAAQADEQQRRMQEQRHGMSVQEEVAGLRDEFANTDKVSLPLTPTLPPPPPLTPTLPLTIPLTPHPHPYRQDDAGTMTTVMAVAMAGRAIRPSLDVLMRLQP